MTSDDTPANLCIFCTNEKGSWEHAFPDWVRRFVLQQGQHYKIVTKRAKGPAEVQVLPYGDIEFKTDAVCQTCNNKWMHNLEDKVIPFLKPMIEGESRTLTLPQQRVLVRWAAKTAVLLEHATGQLPHTPRDRVEQIRLGKPPKGTHVLLSRYVGFRTFEHVTVVLKQTVDGDEFDVAWTTLLIGQVVIHVLADTGEGDEMVISDDAVNVYVPLLAPAGGEVDWPPLYVVGDIGLDTLKRGPNQGFRQASPLPPFYPHPEQT